MVGMQAAIPLANNPVQHRLHPGPVAQRPITTTDGKARIGWRDKDGNVRIMDATHATSTVLPTTDLKP
jgi:hypothetical protein